MAFRVASLPGRGGPNPYVDLFYDALLPHGVELVGKLEFELDWLKRNINKFDAVHLHWPEIHWRGFKTPFLKIMRSSNVYGSYRLGVFLENKFSALFLNEKIKWFENVIDFLKAEEKIIIWTWHNLEPHENVTKLDLLGNQVMSKKADLVIFHSKWAKNKCLDKYEISGKTVVMPHGNYRGIYPTPRPRDLVANELGLDPEKPIVGCLGAIREYKGLDVACDALKILKNKYQFICAGKPHESFDIDDLNAKINGVGTNNVLVPRMISDQEFSDYSNLCDFLLLPYREVTGSGALLAALTFKRGVVCSDLPFFRETLANSLHSGVLVLPNDPEALALGIEKYALVSKDTRNESASRLASRYDWEVVIVPVAEAINNLITSRKTPVQ